MQINYLDNSVGFMLSVLVSWGGVRYKVSMDSAPRESSPRLLLVIYQIILTKENLIGREGCNILT